MSSEDGSSCLWLRATFISFMSVAPASRVVFTILDDGPRNVPLRHVFPCVVDYGLGLGWV